MEISRFGWEKLRKKKEKKAKLKKVTLVKKNITMIMIDDGT